MFSYPASFEEALLHRKARKFGYSSSKMEDGSDAPKCPCCENYVNTVEIPLNYQTQPDQRPSLTDYVFLLPASICLYFTFVKMLITYMIVRFLMLDLYNIVTSFKGRFCTFMSADSFYLGQYCTSFTLGPLANLSKHAKTTLQTSTVLAYLSLTFVVLSIAYFIWYEHYAYNLYYYLENNQVTQDDFTVLI